MNLASVRDGNFTQEDAELLSQVANQIALALENALAFRELDELKNKLAKEKLYLEDEIRSEYNFEEIIGESAALKRILKQVDTVRLDRLHRADSGGDGDRHGVDRQGDP